MDSSATHLLGVLLADIENGHHIGSGLFRLGTAERSQQGRNIHSVSV